MHSLDNSFYAPLNRKIRGLHIPSMLENGESYLQHIYMLQNVISYVFPQPDTPTIQMTSFTPSPSCINPPNPGTPYTEASLSLVLPGHTSIQSPNKHS